MAILKIMGVVTLFFVVTVSEAAEPFSIHTAHYQNLKKEYLLDAVVEAANHSTVSAETSGRITEINFDIGDKVTAGSVLVRVTKAQQQSQLAAAQATESEAQARLKQAEDEYQRVKDVFEKKLVAKSALDKATADLKAAKQRLKAASANVKQAQEKVQYTTVKAPYSGIVVNRHVDLGEMVAPGKPIMTGLSLKSLRLVSHIPQSLINKVRSTKKARFVFPQLDNREVTSKDIRISPQAEVPSYSFLTRAYLPQNTKDLYPGMLAKMVIDVGDRKGLLIPEQALVRRGELTAVYVVNADRVVLRKVRIGRKHGTQVEIHAGIEEGEKVALDPIQAGIYLKEQRQNNNNG